MSAGFIAGIITGAGALLGWLLWSLERGKVEQAELAATKAEDAQTAAEKRSGVLARQLAAAREEIDLLITNPDVCADPAVVAEHLDRVLVDISGALDGDEVRELPDGPTDLIEGPLQ